MVAWRMPASVSLRAYEPLTTWPARCPGAPQAPPAGREALDTGARHVVSRMRFRTRAAETTDGRGRFDDESR